jgi:hypothetical protein
LVLTGSKSRLLSGILIKSLKNIIPIRSASASNGCALAIGGYFRVIEAGLDSVVATSSYFSAIQGLLAALVLPGMVVTHILILLVIE